ncbi:MAG: H-type lectin domain-containing protein [Clostridia bacterium]|nr:H-type lectin domain-containing protein [Clostridia bacterium]
MAVLYTRVYTYTGQSGWTAGARSVPWSDFTASGDTDRSIGQLVSIRYEHYHASTSHKDWALQGKLAFSGGSVTSDTITNTIGSGDVVKYVNTFTSLPTLSQFNALTAVETLYGGSSAQTASPYLTWHATSTHPIRVVVGFYEEPPWVYHPRIEEFALERGTSSGVQDDSGTRALLTLRLSLASASYASYAALKLYYSSGAVSTSSSYVDLSAYISALLGGVTRNSSYITLSFDADYDWSFLLVFSCLGESASATAMLPNDFVALHISPCATGGVSIGDLSTATEGDPKFEVHHPAYLYGGIAQIGSGGGDIAAMLGIQTGVTEAVARTSNGTTELAVSFPRAYSAAPHVMVSFDTSDLSTPTGPFGSYQLSVAAVTASGFTLRMSAATSTNFSPKVRWLAIGT